ncbi:MAG: tetratricopeptide repeat protein, partial [Isosphaeraceae bacterium]
MSLRALARFAGVVVVLGAAAFALRDPVTRWLETPPTVGEAALAVRQGRYDDAERLLDRVLARRPDQRDANLLMAQVLIDRTNPKPARALECLSRVRTRNRQVQAVLRVQEGKALYQLRRLAESESAWLEALELNPRVPEAGWLLIQQYYLQGRDDEVARLALELHPRETDPIDRVRYLLELVREDVERLAAAGVIPWLEPAVKANPGDRASALALGRALVKEGRTEE